MYDPDTVSTTKKTQYGKDVNVGKLCEDTIMKPDEVIYNRRGIKKISRITTRYRK